MLAPILLAALIPLAPTTVPVAMPVPVQAPVAADPIETARTVRRVGPGTTLTSFERLGSGGWVRGDLLTVDLEAGVRAGYLSPGPVSAVEPLSGQAGRAGAIAAVNGDFFDIGRTGAPDGAAVAGGRLVKSARPGRPARTAGVGVNGLGQIARIVLDGEVLLPGGRTVRLDQLNAHTVRGIGAYTPLWGTGARAGGTEVLVLDGKVASVSDRPGSGPIPSNGFVLVENGGGHLRALRPGDPVGLRYRARSSGGRPAFAVGGRQILLEDGRIPALPDPAVHPRTAVGFSSDGRRMLLMTVDGRQPASRGVTTAELAALMKEAGAHDALNLDGGGSSTLLAREPGGSRPKVENAPSGGMERRVPNGIGLFAEGSGRLAGFTVRPSAARVFPGLVRRLTAVPHDEAYGPAEGVPRWLATRGAIGPDGTFRARRPGRVTVTAVRGRARGRARLTVLGPLVRIRAVRDAPGSFRVIGHDREGYTAPIDPSDVRPDYDRSLLEVRPGGGGFTVKPRGPSVRASVTIEVKGRKATLPVGRDAPPPLVPDPMVIRDGVPHGRRFAMVSGSDPRALREAAAARPGLLIVNGDLAGPGGLRAAKERLDGLGVPYAYIPGERETAGPGGAERFREVFGRPWRTFDHQGTRFVLLDSSAGAYWKGAFGQLRMLREALEGARHDPSVDSVIVAGHRPARLGDPKEAALIERWLSRFRAATGKGAAVLDAHGAFAASRLDGVRRFGGGGTGGGAFDGWTMFGVTRSPAARWLRAEVRPHADAVTLTAPAAMPAGTAVRVSAAVRQNGRDLPLAYPMSADWSTSPHLRYDPATGRLKALRPGPATVAVTVNGVRAEAAVRVSRARRSVRPWRSGPRR